MEKNNIIERQFYNCFGLHNARRESKGSSSVAGWLDTPIISRDAIIGNAHAHLTQ
jgi:hypothetical protein